MRFVAFLSRSRRCGVGTEPLLLKLLKDLDQVRIDLSQGRPSRNENERQRADRGESGGYEGKGGRASPLCPAQSDPVALARGEVSTMPSAKKLGSGTVTINHDYAGRRHTAVGGTGQTIGKIELSHSRAGPNFTVGGGTDEELIAR